MGYIGGMTRSLKAMLLSALLFPGAGHLWLKHYWRGAVLMLVTLGAASMLIRSIFERAMTVVDQITAGDIVADTDTIAQMLAATSQARAANHDTALVTVLAVCWVIGIADSFRLGRQQGASPDPSPGRGERP